VSWDKIHTILCVHCWHVSEAHCQPRKGTTESDACEVCECERYKGATKKQELIRELELERELEMRGSQRAHEAIPALMARLRAMS
jgi:hypothetical protein